MERGSRNPRNGIHSRGNRGRLERESPSSSNWQLSLEEQLGGSATMNSDAARVRVKWSPRNGCLIPLISCGFRFCPVSVAFNKLPSSVATSHEYTYGEDRRGDFRGVDVNVEETIFDFLESNVSSSRLKSVYSLFICGELCERELLKYIVSYKLLLGFRNAPFSINLVKLCIILN